MPSVLLHCAQQHYTIGKFGHMKGTIESTTNPRYIRSFTNQIAGWDYAAASRDIANRNALSAAESIQASNNENICWQIILKDAALLEPAGLPAAKGQVMILAWPRRLLRVALWKKLGWERATPGESWS